MTTAILILTAIFLSLPLYVWATEGVLSSISSYSYKLKGNQKAWFMGWLVALGIGSYFLDMGLFSHMMAVGFCISGMSPEHKRNPLSAEDEYHTVGTIVAIASAFIGLFITYGLWIPSAVFVAVTLALWAWSKNWIWWVEILAMLCVSGGLLLLR